MATTKTTSKKAKWVAVVGITAGDGTRIEPGDTVPAAVAKERWLQEQGLIVKEGD